MTRNGLHGPLCLCGRKLVLALCQITHAYVCARAMFTAVRQKFGIRRPSQGQRDDPQEADPQPNGIVDASGRTVIASHYPSQVRTGAVRAKGSAGLRSFAFA